MEYMIFYEFVIDSYGGGEKGRRKKMYRKIKKEKKKVLQIVREKN